MFIAKNNDLIILAKETRAELEEALRFMVYTSIEETTVNYELYNGEYLTPEEKATKERENLNKLKCTKRVFALSLQQLGISYTTLKELIATSPQAQLEWDLCVELERGNPLIDTFATQLGLTSEQIDNIFINAQTEV